MKEKYPPGHGPLPTYEPDDVSLHEIDLTKHVSLWKLHKLLVQKDPALGVPDDQSVPVLALDLVLQSLFQGAFTDKKKKYIYLTKAGEIDVDYLTKADEIDVDGTGLAYAREVGEFGHSVKSRGEAGEKIFQNYTHAEVFDPEILKDPNLWSGTLSFLAQKDGLSNAHYSQWTGYSRNTIDALLKHLVIDKATAENWVEGLGAPRLPEKSGSKWDPLKKEISLLIKEDIAKSPDPYVDLMIGKITPDFKSRLQTKGLEKFPSDEYLARIIGTAIKNKRLKYKLHPRPNR